MPNEVLLTPATLQIWRGWRIRTQQCFPMSFRLQKYSHKDHISLKRIETNQVSDLQKRNDVFTNALFKMSVVLLLNIIAKNEE